MFPIRATHTTFYTVLLILFELSGNKLSDGKSSILIPSFLVHDTLNEFNVGGLPFSTESGKCHQLEIWGVGDGSCPIRSCVLSWEKAQNRWRSISLKNGNLGSVTCSSEPPKSFECVCQMFR